MGPFNLPGPSPYDSDFSADEVLEHFDYIQEVAWRYVPGTIGPVDEEDIAQEVWIKLFLIAQKQQIKKPRSYIKHTFHSVVIDMLRKYKPQLYQAYPTDEDGEIVEEFITNLEDAGKEDPATIFEQETALEECLDELGDAVVMLSPKQKLAAIHTLQEKVDDIVRLLEMFKEKGLNPVVEEPVQKQLIRASYTHARRKIADHMGYRLESFD